MSQILRLGSGHISKTHLSATFSDTASEIVAQFYGCKNCSLLRSRHTYGRKGYSFTSRRKSFTSAQVKEKEGPLIIVSQTKSLEKQLQTYENYLRASIVHSIESKAKSPIGLPWIEEPSYDIVKKTTILIDQPVEEKSKTIQKLREVTRREIKWGAQLKRFQRQLKNRNFKQEVDRFKKSEPSLSTPPGTLKDIQSEQLQKSDSQTLIVKEEKYLTHLKKAKLEDFSQLKKEKSEGLRALKKPNSENLSHLKKTKSEDLSHLKKSKSEDKHKSVNEEDIERRKHYFNQDFKSFVGACLFTDKADVAYLALRYYRCRNSDQFSFRQITDHEVYSNLLHHYAGKDDITKLTDILSCMKELDISPSLPCYVAFLKFLGRQEKFDYEKGREIMEEINTQGYDVRNIFNECVMVRDDRKYILLALNHLIENFVPFPPPGNVPYQGPLVEALNEPVDPSQMVKKNPFSGVVTTDHLCSQFKGQIEMERHGTINIPTIQKKQPLTDKDYQMKDKFEELKESWRNTLHQAFKKKVKNLSSHDRGKYGMKFSPYFKLFDSMEYVDLLMLEIENLAMCSSYYSPSTTALRIRLGRRVYNKYMAKYKQQNGIADQIEKVYKDFAELYTSPDSELLNQREIWNDLCKKYDDGPTIDATLQGWSNPLMKQIGKALYELIMFDLKIDSNLFSSENKRLVPAFYYVFRSHNYLVKAELKPHPVLIKLFTGNYVQHISFETKELPMLVPPLPWSAPNNGGFLLIQNKIIRTSDDSVVDDCISSVPVHQLNPVFDSLNILQMCAWKINKPMLNVIIDVFNGKGNKDLDIPPPVSECPSLPQITPEMTAEKKSAIRQERKQLKKQKQEMHSLWCNELYKLSIANKFKDEVFWFPHNLDFRGRTYPCPPHFNHLGSDVTRSLLKFAKGKPLGEKGLDWLKIHLVNLTGLKKRSSNKDRLAFADEMMDEILDSADNINNGRGWWQTSDEPWQTLAACKEVANAVRSPNPARYVSHFPVHQDGSCNGLQHYAALGRDQAGAESVNLCPFEVPHDVYSDVAELVEQVRQEDAEEGNEIAKVLEGFVRRKVIKQTVMTTVYGVTKYGARYQILKQLKDIPEFPEEHQWKASAYLTETTFKCLEKMFTSTKQIQDWFINSSDLITKLCRKPVEWVTPLGLPVVQPYFKKKMMHMVGHEINLSEQNLHEIPNTVKQKNGFPPNYIHSLDSVHMMLTALHCLRAGITYVSVHDCYWTHPCDVDVMNKICREQFVALHSQPILENLSQFMKDKYCHLLSKPMDKEVLHTVLNSVPKRGTFDLDNVRKSTYFFS